MIGVGQKYHVQYVLIMFLKVIFQNYYQEFDKKKICDTIY